MRISDWSSDVCSSDLELTDDYRAKVTMEIKDDLELPADSEALLRTTSLLGEKFIELRAPDEPGTDEVLVDGDVIEQSGEAPALEFVAEEAGHLIAGVATTDLSTLTTTGDAGSRGRAGRLKAHVDRSR